MMKIKLIPAFIILVGRVVNICAADTDKVGLPMSFCLKNLPHQQNKTPRYTISDFKSFVTIDAYNKSGHFKIKEFQVRCINERTLNEIFHNEGKNFTCFSDSIRPEFLKTLQESFENPFNEITIKIRNVKVIGPDSILRTIEKEQTLAFVYHDSTKLLLYKYFPRWIVQSNLRIKIEGNPTNEDIQTIRNIVSEINALKLNISAKIVDNLPSLVIRIDTGENSTSFVRNLYGNEFFPHISYTRKLIKIISREQYIRDFILWEQVMRSLGDFNETGNSCENSIFIGGCHTKTGLSYEDKLALKAIFSNDFSNTKHGFEDEKTWLFNLSFQVTTQLATLFTILILIVLFFIFYEADNYFGWGTFIKNKVLRITLYAIVLGQMVILAKLVGETHFF